LERNAGENRVSACKYLLMHGLHLSQDRVLTALGHDRLLPQAAAQDVPACRNHCAHISYADEREVEAPRDNRAEQFKVVITVFDASIDGGQIAALYEKR